MVWRSALRAGEGARAGISGQAPGDLLLFALARSPRRGGNADRGRQKPKTRTNKLAGLSRFAARPRDGVNGAPAGRFSRIGEAKDRAGVCLYCDFGQFHALSTAVDLLVDTLARQENDGVFP